jgi:hypothetical protein
MKNSNETVSQISCVLFKKYFLDNSEGINPNDFDLMKQVVLDSLDFKS